MYSDLQTILFLLLLHLALLIHLVFISLAVLHVDVYCIVNEYQSKSVYNEEICSAHSIKLHELSDLRSCNVVQ